ncbi:MAG: rhodanese-like domain-containing protein [Woeseiaceae bacterium]
MSDCLKAKVLLASAVFLAGCGGSTPEVSMVDVAQAAARNADRVSVEELAGWIVEGRGDFALIDIRKSTDFQAGQIADASNIPIAMLVTEEALADLPRDRKVVVYSNGSENAAKATVMLRLSGINAHVLVGGYNAWHERILNPDISAEELNGENLRVSEQRALSCYFVGNREGAALRRSDISEPFVPPVYEEPEPEQGEGLPPLPPPEEEGC